MWIRIIFMTLFVVSALSLLSSCKQRGWDSELSEWELGIFNKQSKLIKAKMWRETEGGRSWTVADEHAYDEWINTVQTDIFTRWDIPTDCADAALALRFIFAIKEGLALSFGEFSSVDYYQNPILFLKKVVGYFGTPNMKRVSYRVNMWHQVNYRGGNFLLYRDKKVGHTMQMLAPTSYNVLQVMQSTVPIKVRNLVKYGLFSTSVENQHFRRFYAIKRTDNILSHDLQISFKAHPPETDKLPNWYDCVSQGESNQTRLDQVPLWQNLFNMLSMFQINPTYNQSAVMKQGYHCIQNLYWYPEFITGKQQLPFPNYRMAIEAMYQNVCDYVQSRSDAVNEGFENCYQSTDDATSRCSADKSGDFSTPSRDYKMFEKIQMLRIAILKLRAAEYVHRTCKINYKIMGENKTREVQLFQSNGDMSMWLILLNNRYLKSKGKKEKPFANSISDPKLSIPERWSCPKYDHSLVCLKIRFPGDLALYLLQDERLPTEFGSLKLNHTYFLNKLAENKASLFRLGSIFRKNVSNTCLATSSGRMMVQKISHLNDYVLANYITQQQGDNFCQSGDFLLVPVALMSQMID